VVRRRPADGVGGPPGVRQAVAAGAAGGGGAARKRACEACTVTEQDPEIAPPREKLTVWTGRWPTRQAGRARPVDEVAEELGCSWHRVNASVQCWGSALLEADTARIPDVEALGLSGPYRAAFGAAALDAAQVADPFHVVGLGNTAPDEVRRDNLARPS
jgi:hypothetical protein